jgi:tRNA G18 (ribose-2'-O)-methylase SpoU
MSTGINPATDTRNVIDEFKGMSDDFVRLELQKRRTPMISIALNLSHDFNKAACMRAHNAYAGKKFIFLNKPNDQIKDSKEGTKRWDKRGAVGTQNYESISHLSIEYWEELFSDLRSEGYRIYAVDNSTGFSPKPIYDTVMPELSVFVYGEEGLGIPTEIIKACDEMIYIPQFGSVRSLNISQAAATVMYEYSRQHRPNLG